MNKTNVNDIYKILNEREGEHGSVRGHGGVTQGMKVLMRDHDGWANLPDYQRECLEMIVHKIGRILNGKRNHVDSWQDVAGYSLCAVSEMEAEEQADALESVSARIEAEAKDISGEWIMWSGGECPVDKEQLVEVFIRAGGYRNVALRAGEVCWKHNSLMAGMDVIFYRPTTR